MAYGPDATDTEQAYLTWELAPVARPGGRHRRASAQQIRLGRLTNKHVRGGETRSRIRIRDRAESSDGGSGGVTVHAAYCGSVSGKLSFLRRVEALARDPSGLAEAPDADELAGCHAYDKTIFAPADAPPGTATRLIGFETRLY